MPASLTREDALRTVGTEKMWDVIVVGGGATGLGTAVEAASRGYETLLLEAYDFAKGTAKWALRAGLAAVPGLGERLVTLHYALIAQRV